MAKIGFKYVQPESSVVGFITIPLKAKYRSIGPKGTGCKSRTGSSHGNRKVVTAGQGHRRKAYGPW